MSVVVTAVLVIAVVLRVVVLEVVIASVVITAVVITVVEFYHLNVQRGSKSVTFSLFSASLILSYRDKLVVSTHHLKAKVMFCRSVIVSTTLVLFMSSCSSDIIRCK